MSETFYSRKSQQNFKKTALSQEDKETKDIFNSMRKPGDSWKISNKYKTSNNFRKINNILEPRIENNIISPINKNKSKSTKNIQKSEYKFFNFKFNKAPTLKQNQQEISNIIKKKKLKKMTELRNIYNNILINKSKSFRSSLYITGNGYISQQNSKLRKNRSSDESNIIQKNFVYKAINERNTSSAENSKLFSKTGFNYNSPKKIFGQKTNSINKSVIFQEINKSKKSNSKNILPILSNINKNNVELPNKTLSKMRMMANDVIFNELKSLKEFWDKENKMIKFRIIQNIHNKEIKNMNTNDGGNIDIKLNRLKDLHNLIENNYASFSFNINSYIYFIKDKIYEIQENIKNIDKEIFNKNIDIEKLVIKIVKKQKELEYLIEIRNFLLIVKDKYENNEKEPIYYFKLLIKDTKKYLIGNYFLNLKIINQITNKSLALFMSSFLELKQKIEDNKIFINEYEYNIHYFKKEKIKPVFESVDEFMKLYNFHMEKNMNYLQIFESIKKSINKLKDQYNEIYINDNNNLLEEEIIEKKEIKKKLIKNNELLKKRFIYYKEHISKKRTEIEIKTPKKTKNIPKYMDIYIDLDLIYRENYKKKIKTLKYNGMLLLQKIILLVKNIFKLNYIKNDFYESYLKNDKIYLIDLKTDEFNDDNVQLIDEYILNLISVYEDICKYVFSKHKNYLYDKNNEEFIIKKLEETNYLNKIKIGKEQRKMKIIKNKEENQKIIDKCYKPIVYIENKIVTDTKIKKHNILKIKKEKNLENDEKNFEENEFNNLTKYHEEELI